MAPNKRKDTRPPGMSQAEVHELLQEKMRQAVRLALVMVLEEEVSVLIGADRYERNPQRSDQRNGYYQRNLDTTVGRIEDLPVPRTRKGHQTQVFERYARRQAELDQAIADMFIGGVSTTRVAEVVETLTGTKASASTVSRVYQGLEDEFESWKKRPLVEQYLYAFGDGVYFTVIYEHEGCKMPIIAVVGIREDGQREMLAFRVGERENQPAWEELLQDLRDRGLKKIGLWITDGGAAMRAAIEVKFPSTPRQRCIKHKLDNVLGYVPRKHWDHIRPELRAIFYQNSRHDAEQEAAAFCAKYQADYPSAVACLQRDLAACLTFYDFPKAHWPSIRTNNIIERLNREVKQRTHKMGAAFRNEDSCLLLFYAVIRSIKFRRIPLPAR